MAKGDFIVPLDQSVLVPFKDCSVAGHSERVQFGGAKCSHAGSAEHFDSFAERIQDFALPDRPGAMKNPVDQYDGSHAGRDDAVDIAS
jgi:hypothetical protein